MQTIKPIIHPILLPYQTRWIMDPAPVAVAVKSRRIGISWCEAAYDVYGASLGNAGWDTWYTGYNKEMAAEFINDCAWWARLFNVVCSDREEFLITEDEREIITYRIHFPNGRRITALASHPRNFRNKKGRLVIDEAAHVDNLDEMRKAALAVLVWGGQVRFISTHNGEGHPFRKMQTDIWEGKLPYSLHEITLDDALNEGLFRRICQVQGKEWTVEGEQEFRNSLIDQYKDDAQEELFCIPKKAQGGYFTPDLIRSCMVDRGKVVYWKRDKSFMLWSEEAREIAARDWFNRELLPLLKALNPSARHVFGEDFGRSGDQTVIDIGQRAADLKTRVPIQIELENIPFDQQWQILDWTLERLPRFSGGKMDKTGNGAYLAEKAVQKYGPSMVEGVDLSRTWYQNNFPPLKARMERRELEIPTHESILDDFMAVELKDGVPQVVKKRKKGERGEQRHGESAVAMVLMDSKMKEITGDVRAGDKKPEYETVVKRPAGSGFAGTRGTF